MIGLNISIGQSRSRSTRRDGTSPEVAGGGLGIGRDKEEGEGIRVEIPQDQVFRYAHDISNESVLTVSRTTESDAKD